MLHQVDFVNYQKQILIKKLYIEWKIVVINHQDYIYV